MASWKTITPDASGRRVVLALGALYVALAIGWAYVEITGGTPVSNALLISIFIGSPGVALLYGGSRLPRSDINPNFYPNIARWCLSAILVMTGLLTTYHLQPAASMNNPVRGILIVTAFVVVPAFAGGYNDARARSRAFELERARDLLQKTERTADVGGWEIDPDTMDVFWTEHTFELLEMPYDEEPPMDEALDMYYDDDQPIVETAVQEALDEGEPFDVEARIRTADGKRRWLRLQGVPETVDGEVTSLRGAAQDITERKERERDLERANERLKKSNERLEQFAYAASHDLQEPLRMVSSYLRLIERRADDELTEETEEYLEFAVDGADRMRAMVEGLLEYSRVEMRGGPLEPVDLDEVVGAVLHDLDVQITEHDAEIHVEELPSVAGDEQQLRQVFQNLLQNAIEYSDDPPKVRVSARRNGTTWTVSVEDEGVGIPPDEQDRIFEIFERLNPENGQTGSGIGLALSERIVERHGGEMWVDSEPGGGSTFSITLPAKGESDE